MAQPGDKKYLWFNYSGLRRELSIKKLWHDRTWAGIFEHMFTVLVISVLPTFYDVSTDSLSAKSFISGANYTKHVKNLSDPAFHENCIHTGRFTTFHPEQELAYEEISCFEKDPIWGTVTVLLIFLPGVYFASELRGVIQEILGLEKRCCRLLHWILLFPSFSLVISHLVSLLSPNPPSQHCRRGI